MRISHKHKLIFLAVTRAGSTTIRSILDDHSDIKSVSAPETSEEFPFHDHMSASELKRVFEEKGWNWSVYKKFCVVRNPYDRVVSFYHYHQSVLFARLRTEGPTRNFIWRAKYERKLKKPFKSFARHLNTTKRMYAPLQFFISDIDGNSLVKDILRFETLTENLPTYLNDLEIHVAPENIPHLNASKKRKEYREYYDTKTKKHIGKLYAYEIDQFNYFF